MENIGFLDTMDRLIHLRKKKCPNPCQHSASHLEDESNSLFVSSPSLQGFMFCRHRHLPCVVWRSIDYVHVCAKSTLESYKMQKLNNAPTRHVSSPGHVPCRSGCVARRLLVAHANEFHAVPSARDRNWCNRYANNLSCSITSNAKVANERQLKMSFNNVLRKRKMNLWGKKVLRMT